MKKSLILIAIAFVSLSLIYCNPARKAQSTTPRLTYVADLQPIINTHCTPCHIPPKGNKKPFDTYLRVHDNIDSMIARIHLQPGQRGFMPFKKAKLPDSVIRVFEQWKADGRLEK